jgi:hypothetical protein
MVNPRPLKLSNAALLHYLKNAFLEQNRLGLQKKSYFWPSKWRFFKNVALEPIWVGHGWSRAFYQRKFSTDFCEYVSFSLMLDNMHIYVKYSIFFIFLVFFLFGKKKWKFWKSDKRCKKQ